MINDKCQHAVTVCLGFMYTVTEFKRTLWLRYNYDYIMNQVLAAKPCRDTALVTEDAMWNKQHSHAKLARSCTACTAAHYQLVPIKKQFICESCLVISGPRATNTKLCLWISKKRERPEVFLFSLCSHSTPHWYLFLEQERSSHGGHFWLRNSLHLTLDLVEL